MTNQRSGYEKKMMTALSRMSGETRRVFGHKELAEEVGIDPRKVNIILKKLHREGLLEYEGLKNDQYTYLVKRKLYAQAGLLNAQPQEKLVEKRKLKVTREILGRKISSTTKVETKEVSPKPSKVTEESEKSLSGGLGTPQLVGQVEYRQSERAKLEFEKNKRRKPKTSPGVEVV